MSYDKYEYHRTWYTYKMETSPGVYNGAYLGGLVTHTFTASSYIHNNYSLHTELADTDRWYGYEWWDGGMKDWEAWDPNTGDPNNPHNFSYLDYDASGHLTQVRFDEATNHTATYVTDVMGQVMQRKDTATPTKREAHHYFNGLKVGDVTWNGTTIMSADFGQAYEAATEGPGGAGTSARYTVREGDTFALIATMLWGDAALWYMIAEANGMTSDTELAAGMTLVIPNKIHNVHNNADTFRPYDPNAAVGPTSPTKPKPAPPQSRDDGGCGPLQIFVAIIAVVVTAFVAPWAAGHVAGFLAGGGTVAAGSFAAVAGGAIGGAVGAAAGSIVSQGAAMAMGIQDEFSWNAVGLAAVGGAISGGIAGKFGPATTFAERAGRAMVTNAATQGIGVATGMQEKFSWTAVAVSGVVAGVGGWVSDNIGGAGVWVDGEWIEPSMPNQIVSGVAGGIAGAAAYSVIEGTDFGDTLMAMLPDIIAQTAGNAIAGALTGSTARNAELRERYGLDDEPLPAREGFVPFDESKLVSAVPAESSASGENWGQSILRGGRFSLASRSLNALGEITLIGNNKETPTQIARRLAAPYISPYDPNDPDYHSYEVGPNVVYIFGPGSEFSMDQINNVVQFFSVPNQFLGSPGPGNYNITGWLPGNQNPIRNYSPAEGVFINQTLSDHWFDPGRVVTISFQHDNKAYVYSVGVGIGDNQVFNKVMGNILFTQMQVQVGMTLTPDPKYHNPMILP